MKSFSIQNYYRDDDVLVICFWNKKLEQNQIRRCISNRILPETYECLGKLTLVTHILFLTIRVLVSKFNELLVSEICRIEVGFMKWNLEAHPKVRKLSYTGFFFGGSLVVPLHDLAQLFREAVVSPLRSDSLFVRRP